MKILITHSVSKIKLMGDWNEVIHVPIQLDNTADILETFESAYNGYMNIKEAYKKVKCSSNDIYILVVCDDVVYLKFIEELLLYGDCDLVTRALNLIFLHVIYLNPF